MAFPDQIRSYGIGFIIALIVLIICVIAFLGAITVSSGLVLGLIASLALARLL